jgi:hypothetical protein
MDKKSSLFNKILVISILILFFNMINVSSNSIVMNYNSDNHISLSPIEFFMEKDSFETTVYWFTENPAMFHARGPGNITWSREWEGDDFFSGGTWTNDGRLLCCLHENGTLYDIDPKTFDAYAIGDGGVSLNSLAYDPINEKLYGAANYDLYEIDVETGEQELIGPFGGIVGYMIGIAFDIDGNLFGWDLESDSLWTIDTYTGGASLVGSLGINIIYAQDGSFDFLTDTLYLAAYTHSGGALYSCDEDTGECALIGYFEGGVAVSVFVVSYELNLEPPNTKVILDPPEPNGLNGWYVSDVNVTLNATDNSGIIYTYYRINDNHWMIYKSPFIISEDGECYIEFYSYDYIGNFEEIKSSTFIIDKTEPETQLTYEVLGGNPWKGWDFEFTLMATDYMSGMERAEFYMDGELQDTIYGPGPEYSWIYHYTGIPNYSFFVRGFILFPEKNKENISFFAIYVKITEAPYYDVFDKNVRGCGYNYAGLKGCDEIEHTPKKESIKPGVFIFQRLTLPNNFKGYLGPFFIFAKFNKS